MSRSHNICRLSSLCKGARVSIAFICIILLVSCKSHLHKDKKIFCYNESSGLASLDPAFAKNKQVMWAVHQLYNTLVEIDASLQIKPSLAKHWDVSADRKIFTFYLRNDVYFHDDMVFERGKGRKLTAKDVVYSFNRIIDPATASPGAWIFNDRVDSVSPFVAINDSVFQLHLKRPFQSILGLLSMQYCSVVPFEAVKKYGDQFRRHPVGSGPFQLLVWEEGQVLVLKKNPQYFEKNQAGKRLPYLDGVKVSFNDSKATEFMEFRQGKLDFIDDIDPSFKDEVLTKTGTLKKDWEGKIILQKHPYLNVEYFGILMDTANPIRNKSLSIKKVRQAINYAIDKRKLMLYMRNSIGTPAENGFVPVGLPSFDTIVKGYSYDIEKAKQLLKDAGYGNGVDGITLTTIPQYADIATFVANELKQVNIAVRVEIVQKSLLLQQTSKSTVPFFRGSWIADYPDAENYLSVFYGKNPSPPNYTRYNNPTVNNLYERSLSELNDSIRYELYRTIDRMVIDDAPVIPLWYDMVIHLVQPGISNFYPNSINLLELRRVQKN